MTLAWCLWVAAVVSLLIPLGYRSRASQGVALHPPEFLWRLCLRGLQRRCKHPASLVIEDLQNGSDPAWRVQWCTVCGAVRCAPQFAMEAVFERPDHTLTQRGGDDFAATLKVLATVRFVLVCAAAGVFFWTAGGGAL